VTKCGDSNERSNIEQRVEDNILKSPTSFTTSRDYLCRARLVRRIANLNLPRILSIRFSLNWVANSFGSVGGNLVPGQRVETTTRRPERKKFLVGRRPDNGLSAMGAWNPHAGLVYRPPTRTPTSMLCASSSVRARQVPVHFCSPRQRELDAHTLLIRNSTHARPPDIHQRPHPALPVRSFSAMYYWTDWLSVVSPLISYFFFSPFDVCAIVIR